MATRRFDEEFARASVMHMRKYTEEMRDARATPRCLRVA